MHAGSERSLARAQTEAQGVVSRVLVLGRVPFGGRVAGKEAEYQSLKLWRSRNTVPVPRKQVEPDVLARVGLVGVVGGADLAVEPLI